MKALQQPTQPNEPSLWQLVKQQVKQSAWEFFQPLRDFINYWKKEFNS